MDSLLTARAKRAWRVIKRREALAAISAVSLFAGQMLFGDEPTPAVNAPAAQTAGTAEQAAPQVTENPFTQKKNKAKKEDQPQGGTLAPITTRDRMASGKSDPSAAPAAESQGGASSRRLAKERGVEAPSAPLPQEVPVVKAQPLPAAAPVTQTGAAKESTPVAPSAANAQAQPAKENLAPIVSAASMPKRPRRTPAATGAKTAVAAAPTAALTAAAPAQADLKTPPARSAAAPVATSANNEPHLAPITTSAKKIAAVGTGTGASHPTTANASATQPSAPKGSLVPATSATAAAAAKSVVTQKSDAGGKPGAAAPETAIAPTKVAAESTAAPSKDSLAKESPAKPPADFASRLANGPQPETTSTGPGGTAPGKSGLAPAKIAAALAQTIPTEEPPASTLRESNRSTKSPPGNVLTPGNGQSNSGLPAVAKSALEPTKSQNPPAVLPDARNLVAAPAKAAQGIIHAFAPQTSARSPGVKRAEFEAATPANALMPAENAPAKFANSAPAARPRSGGAPNQVAMNTATHTDTAAPSQSVANSRSALPTSASGSPSIRGVVPRNAPLAAGNMPWSRPAAPALHVGTPTPATPLVATARAGSRSSASADSLPEMGLPPLPPQSLQNASAAGPDATQVASASHEERGSALPFEQIKESGTVKLRAGQPLLLRMRADVYRTAVVDGSVCDIERITMRELSIVPRGVGRTHITFFFDDPQSPQLTYLVDVQPDAAQ